MLKVALWRGYVDEFGQIASTIKPPKALKGVGEALTSIGQPPKAITKQFLPRTMSQGAKPFSIRAATGGGWKRIMKGGGPMAKAQRAAQTGATPQSYHSIVKGMETAQKSGDAYVYNNLKKLYDRLFVTSHHHQPKVPEGLGL